MESVEDNVEVENAENHEDKADGAIAVERTKKKKKKKKRSGVHLAKYMIIAPPPLHCKRPWIVRTGFH